MVRGSFWRKALKEVIMNEGLLGNMQKNMLLKLLIHSIRFMFLKRGMSFGLDIRTMVIIPPMGIEWFVMWFFIGTQRTEPMNFSYHTAPRYGTQILPMKA